MEVKDCMTKNVYCCDPSANVVDAANLMKENHVGCVPVCDENKKVVGIVTDRDIILRTICCNKDVNTTPVSEIMTSKVHFCKLDTKIEEATKVMSDEQIRRIPVCDEQNKVVGMLTLGDLSHHEEKVGEDKVVDTLGNICECKQNDKNAE